MTDVNLLPLLPALQVLIAALVVTVRDLFIKDGVPRGVLALYSLIGLALAAEAVVRRERDIRRQRALLVGDIALCSCGRASCMEQHGRKDGGGDKGEPQSLKPLGSGQLCSRPG